MINWAQATPPIIAAFLASFVECVEALTIFLAVGTVRGWRSALLGAGLGLAVLLCIVAVFGQALGHVRLDIVRSVVGVLLLLFGLRWLRKAVLRSAGVIPLRDEEAAFTRNTAALRQENSASRQWDMIAIVTVFKAVMLEGFEVVFIVLAIGAVKNLLAPASIGAVAALLCVSVLGIILHRPLARIPENILKFAVGVLLCSFGTFWIGESMGMQWPGADWFVLMLVAGYLSAALAAVRLCRSKRHADIR